MKSILLVEDDPGLREATYQVLEGAGYHVVEVLDGSRGRDLLERIQPSLVLVDLEAPGGADLSAWIAGQPQLASVPVVLMTAFDLDHLPFSISGALHKPFDLDELLNLVATLIDN
jgi:two-component system chemotaxis response regulator CheY